MTATTGVLFDVDGTLVDTTYVHTLCWWQALRAAGHDASMARIHRAIGMGADQLVENVLGPGHNDELDALSSAHGAIYSTYWSQLRPLPGAHELLKRCRYEGLTVVLASSAEANEVAVLIEVLDADDLIDVMTTSDDAERSKPAPDIVEVALAKAGLDVRSAVFVGDAVWDMQASVRVGLSCIGLASGGTSHRELEDAGAAATFDDPADLLDKFHQITRLITQRSRNQDGTS